ncbi:unnamed protein product [Adineta ricciae]|uniref:DUF427 domain-containing protein n=1 Tax=Adineta ricciae TaxID=249248 RepID=A0A815QSI8_ADIRI|nr:unnamed protein product [Adineta ricciae]
MASNLPLENVWDYPRPPEIEPVQARLRVIFNQIVLADTTRAMRIIETGHPPTYYIPPEDVKQEYLNRNDKTSYCGYKGLASYYDFILPDNQPIVKARIWSYENPTGSDEKYIGVKGYFSFYVGPWDCYVNDEKVEAQPGDFYGGWKTKNIMGKVNAGSGAWIIDYKMTNNPSRYITEQPDTFNTVFALAPQERISNIYECDDRRCGCGSKYTVALTNERIIQRRADSCCGCCSQGYIDSMLFLSDISSISTRVNPTRNGMPLTLTGPFGSEVFTFSRQSFHNALAMIPQAAMPHKISTQPRIVMQTPYSAPPYETKPMKPDYQSAF